MSSFNLSDVSCCRKNNTIVQMMVILLSLVKPKRDYERKKIVSDLTAACMNEPQFYDSLILILNHFKPKHLKT